MADDAPNNETKEEEETNPPHAESDGTDPHLGVGDDIDQEAEQKIYPKTSTPRRQSGRLAVRKKPNLKADTDAEDLVDSPSLKRKRPAQKQARSERKKP